jgi:ribokinase
VSARIVVLGSCNTDMVVRLPHLPAPGETVMGGEFMMVQGGKGANQAVAAARSGGRVAMIGRIGADAFGIQACAALHAEGIDVSHLIRDPATPSGVALITVDAAGENSIAVAPGANARVSPDDVRHARDLITGADVLVANLEVPVESVSEAVALASSAGVPVLLNPAPAVPLTDALLQQVTILTPNEIEAALLAGITIHDDDSIVAAADALRKRGAATVILTLGERGVYFNDGTLQIWVPAFHVCPIDTTAAGDVFTGALAVALGEHQTPIDATYFACAASAISVTRPGAQPSAPQRPEIEALLLDYHTPPWPTS